VRLRSQILIFLLLFGIAPLLAAVVINLPLVLGSLELFYQKAYLQNLRADFRDLDQHLASRHEMVRLLAKLPEPGTLLGKSTTNDAVDRARARYTQWANQVLDDQLDIIQILFMDDQGRPRFWLERDPRTTRWHPTTTLPEPPPQELVSAALGLEAPRVLVSRIRLAPDDRGPPQGHLMTLNLITPIFDRKHPSALPIGLVAITLDVGGMARFYRNTLWVDNKGSYLVSNKALSSPGRAFADFPGLDAIFAAGKLGLWEGADGREILWVPMFLTENSGPLWVGRQVDPSPLAKFRNALVKRVLAIILVLVVIVILLARWIAVRLERFGHQLTQGIGDMLAEDEQVHFEWRGPPEIRDLGRDLTALARSHAEHARSLRRHAEALEASNRYKSEFLANVSHELRTPLNSILLLSKLLAAPDSGLPLEQRRQAQVIHQAGDDLRALIDNILDLSRIEAGRTQFHLEWVRPVDLVREVVELMQPQFDAKGLFLRLEQSPDLPERLYTDAYKVRQIVKNFLSNAVKFTRTGGVTLRLGPGGDPQHALSIAVVDTGIGIPPAKQALVFEAFRQADGSTSRRYGGTGLGLSISRRLAHLLGGEITLESREGAGATFTLLLPERIPQVESEGPQPPVPEPASAPASAPSPPTPQAVPETDLSAACILLLANDVSSLLDLVPRLEAWGARVSAAADPDEALEGLREDPACQVLLLDLDAPGADACDTIHVIRRQPGFAHLEVVLLGGAEAPPCAGGPGIVHLPRPFAPEELKEALRRGLGYGG